jgi:3-hydroxyacyl-CoA dehydrogenase
LITPTAGYESERPNDPRAADGSPAAAPTVQSVTVLGAGTMGARIAAHLANNGVRCDLLDIAGAAGDRNAAARRGLEATRKGRPAAFYDATAASLIRIGNFEDDLDRVRQADWIIEAVVEDLAIKRTLLAKVAPLLRPDALLTTNTSGIPVAAIGAELPPAVRRRWFGTHFFNPPRYMKLLEVIPAPETDPPALARIADFCDRRLGKGIVQAKDTPNFIANRIGTFSMLNVLRVMQQMNFSIEQVDALTGPALGWPKSATFRTADMVGLDLLAHVVRNSYENLPADPERELFRVPPFLEEMLRRGWLGEKTGQGFYKRQKAAGGESEILALDLATFEYHPRARVRFPSLDIAKNTDDPAARLKAIVFARDPAGDFLWRTLSGLFLYSAQHLAEIADDPWQIDRAMRWGFNWRMGPFEMWDALGLEEVVIRLHAEGRTIPDYVTQLLASGAKSFYRDAPAPSATGLQREAFSPRSRNWAPVPVPHGVLALDPLRRAGRELRRNAGCSVIDLGDGVGCLEFHAKMNAIGADIMQMVTATLRDTKSPFDAFVVSNDGENFSAGANLMLLLMEIQEANWDDVSLATQSFQAMTMAIKRSPRPVVVAPFGLALGGGCETLLHGAAAVAHAELYCGLVELGVGLIPAGGGTKEMSLRAVRASERLHGASPGAGGGESVAVQEAIKAAFETIALAKVSTSAAEARRLGLLRTSDVIVPNRDRLLSTAKSEALRLVAEGYTPPPNESWPAPGVNVRATLQLGAYLMHEGGYITDYELKLAHKLAYVLCGGDVAGGTVVDEDYMLALEREAFLSLCGERKTQERIQHTLKTGKPLRN